MHIDLLVFVSKLGNPNFWIWGFVTDWLDYEHYWLDLLFLCWNSARIGGFGLELAESTRRIDLVNRVRPSSWLIHIDRDIFLLRLEIGILTSWIPVNSGELTGQVGILGDSRPQTEVETLTRLRNLTNLMYDYLFCDLNDLIELRPILKFVFFWLTRVYMIIMCVTVMIRVN